MTSAADDARPGQESGDARLVVVFEKVRPSLEEAGRHDKEMPAHIRVVARDQVIVKPFVVGVIEAQFQQPRLQVPVGFGQEEKVGPFLPDRPMASVQNSVSGAG